VGQQAGQTSTAAPGRVHGGTHCQRAEETGRKMRGQTQGERWISSVLCVFFVIWGTEIDENVHEETYVEVWSSSVFYVFFVFLGTKIDGKWSRNGSRGPFGG